MTATTATQPPRSANEPWYRRWLRDPMVRRAIVITLVMRIALGVFGWIALALEPPPRASAVERGIAHHHVLSVVAGPWEHFDAIIYQRIALRGYPTGSNDTAFYPLFPLVLKPVALALGG